MKRDILIIDTDSDFISELHNSLESKVNLISAQSIEEAFAFCNANKNKNSSQSNINPSVIVVYFVMLFKLLFLKNPKLAFAQTWNNILLKEGIKILQRN